MVETNGKVEKANGLSGGSFKTLGERIAAARRLRGLNKTEFAAKMGLSKATISDWESGKIKNLRMEHIFRLADVLQVSARWIALAQGIPMRRWLESAEEYELVARFREMKDSSKSDLLAAARVLGVSDRKGAPSAYNPFNIPRPTQK
jgi:transcriptional regulator with XRE-family HTH domain